LILPARFRIDFWGKKERKRENKKKEKKKKAGERKNEGEKTLRGFVPSSAAEGTVAGTRKFSSLLRSRMRMKNLFPASGH
jgi:hypothetical protein